jgi:primosomal protein N' (replication factor Y) (superfamily II helicase)
MENHSTIVSVLVDVHVDKPLDYTFRQMRPEHVKRGMQVTVPLRGQIRSGLILEVKEKSDCPNLLPVHSLVSEESLVTEELFELALWMAGYYRCSLRQALKVILPSSLRKTAVPKELFYVKRVLSKDKLRDFCFANREKNPSQAKIIDEILMAKEGIFLSELLEKTNVSRSPVESLEKKGILKIEKIRSFRSPLVGEEYFKTQPKQLNDGQAEALKKIVSSIKSKIFETHLLYGITGSGKTEVYLQSIERALSQGLSSIMLVPEISLTAQIIEKLRSRFESQIAILHHRLSLGERTDEWFRIKSGTAKIVIGPRSALFSPVQNLGLIIVDEEHDAAYKQSEEPPCYHARDVAVMRGKINQAVVVLGTATPSLESYYNTQLGKYHLSKLSIRASHSLLPRVHIVDMKREYEKANGFTCFSELLIEKIKEKLASGEQAILFLNRRGYHTSLQCKECGHIFSCDSCAVALTFHRGENMLACHLCDKKISPPPTLCPKCKACAALKFTGVGTEQLERSVKALFPEARTLRVDGDTTKNKGSHERLFRIFSTQKADILIGTQMVAKGLHFPSVTLVAVIYGDAGLHIPDFRASEKVFQQITQVAGRSGRAELPGEVIIQTLLPEHATISYAAAQDFDSFYSAEMETRKIFSFPPFIHLVKLIFSGKNALQTQSSAERMCRYLSQRLSRRCQVHPVIPCGYAKIKDFYRFQCLIRGQSIYEINKILEQFLVEKALPKNIRLHIDVDPLSTFF